jgi:hypothetical protein
LSIRLHIVLSRLLNAKTILEIRTYLHERHILLKRVQQ